MGHIRLGVLPRSRKWQQVIEELRLGSEVTIVAAAAADAAEESFQRASTDPAFLHAFWLLTQIPLAARGPAFAANLRRLGLAVADQPSLIEVLGAFSGAVDRYAQKHGGRTDLGEMAQIAAVESLSAIVGPSLTSLFGAGPEDVQRAVGRFASGDRFSQLAREFFARLTLCCTGRGSGRTGPYPVRGQAMRTDSGRPSSSMRLSAWTPTLTSVARRRSVRACSPSPITRL